MEGMLKYFCKTSAFNLCDVYKKMITRANLQLFPRDNHDLND